MRIHIENFIHRMSVCVNYKADFRETAYAVGTAVNMY